MDHAVQEGARTEKDGEDAGGRAEGQKEERFDDAKGSAESGASSRSCEADKVRSLKVMDYRSEELPVEKAVALTGAFAFKEAAQLVRSGQISIDGVAAQAGQLVTPRSVLTHLGSELPPRAPIVYYLLNKPRGVMTTVADGPWKRSAEGGTVLDLVPPYPRVVPVGRLDYDSEGLLMLTNDGSFVTAATSPRYHLDKTYLALIESKRKDRYSGVPSSELLQRMLREGVDVHGDVFRCTQLSVAAAEDEGQRGTAALCWLRVVLQEGKKREVRRMLSSVGYNVLRLIRVGIHVIRGPCHQESHLSFDPHCGGGGRREERLVQLVERGATLRPGEASLLRKEEVDAVFAHCLLADAEQPA